MQMKDFQYHMPTQLIFDNSGSIEWDKLVKGSKLLMMCDPFLFHNGTAQKIAQATKIDSVVYFHEIEPNPSCQTIDNAAAIARESAVNVVIGLGGGSALDASKVVACLVDNEGSIFDYYSGGERTFKHRKAQLICIPTTAGTGSEVTNIGVYTNQMTNTKMPFASPLFWADIALIDPELTHTLPPHITASTGMDAFCHAIEAYWSINANPISDALAISVLKTILENLECVYQDATNREARAKMSYASVTAGMAFSQTKTTGVHAVSFPLTADFGASHGVACSITLPAFIRFAYAGNREKMDVLISLLGFNGIDEFVSRVESLMLSVGLPIRLSDIHVKDSDLDYIVEVSMKAPIVHFTPGKMDEVKLLELLKSIL